MTLLLSVGDILPQILKQMCCLVGSGLVVVDGLFPSKHLVRIAWHILTNSEPLTAAAAGVMTLQMMVAVVFTVPLFCLKYIPPGVKHTLLLGSLP